MFNSNGDCGHVGFSLTLQGLPLVFLHETVVHGYAHLCRSIQQFLFHLLFLSEIDVDLCQHLFHLVKMYCFLMQKVGLVYFYFFIGIKIFS